MKLKKKCRLNFTSRSSRATIVESSDFYVWYMQILFKCKTCKMSFPQVINVYFTHAGRKCIHVRYLLQLYLIIWYIYIRRSTLFGSEDKLVTGISAASIAIKIRLEFDKMYVHSSVAFECCVLCLSLDTWNSSLPSDSNRLYWNLG
jgi:hypothetical protein